MCRRPTGQGVCGQRLGAHRGAGASAAGAVLRAAPGRGAAAQGRPGARRRRASPAGDPHQQRPRRCCGGRAPGPACCCCSWCGCWRQASARVGGPGPPPPAHTAVAAAPAAINRSCRTGGCRGAGVHTAAVARCGGPGSGRGSRLLGGLRRGRQGDQVRLANGMAGHLLARLAPFAYMCQLGCCTRWLWTHVPRRTSTAITWHASNMGQHGMGRAAAVMMPEVDVCACPHAHARP